MAKVRFEVQLVCDRSVAGGRLVTIDSNSLFPSVNVFLDEETPPTLWARKKPLVPIHIRQLEYLT